MNTVEKGDIARLKVEMRAREKGIVVSKPTTENTRYDLILDDGKLERVQVKYAGVTTGDGESCYSARLDCKNKERKNGRVYESGEVDSLLVYIHAMDCICKIPKANFIGKKSLTIRTKPAKNNQKSGIFMLENYRW